MEGTPQPDVDVGRSLRFPFADRDWPSKILIGALLVLLCLIGVGVPVLLGYLRRLFLAVVQDLDAPLPEPDPWRDLADGIPATLVLLLYAAMTLLLLQLPCVGLVLAVALLFLLPASLTGLFAMGRLGAAFDVAWIADYVRDNGPNYLLAFLLWIVTGVLAALGVALLIVGVFATSFWALLVSGHGMAQVYRNSHLVTPHAVSVVPEPPTPANAAPAVS